jgi:hypothetical protein
LKSTDDLRKFIFFDRETQKLKSRSYNYIIDDNTWQFNEITRLFFTDSQIKHAHLANHFESVRYAGEFHLRTGFGWNRINDQWEIVFNNASDTYSPNDALLIIVRKKTLLI